MSKIISVVIPVYNEEESLLLLYKRLKPMLDQLSYAYEILLVNDGSRDKSLEIMKILQQRDPAISYINLSRNYGKEVAMAAGLDYAVGDAVIVMDADLQDPPELIGQMVACWEEGYDDVFAKRISRDGETFFKKISSYTYYRILKKMSKIPIHEDTGDFRLLSRRAVEALKEIKEQHRYTKGYFDWIGFEKKEILFKREPRVAGRTKWNYGSLFNLAIEGMTSFSIFPLRVSSFIGMGTLFAAFLYLLAKLIGLAAFSSRFDIDALILFLLLFFSGIILFCMGVLGEYVGRIFNETKNRPLYFIAEYHAGKPALSKGGALTVNSHK